MYILLLVFHIIVCFVLIAEILLQASKGAGFGGLFGGGGDTSQSVFGTQTPAILKKATTISAIVFLSTSLLLGIVTARRGRSLFERQQMQAVPAMPGGTETVPQVPSVPETPPVSAEQAPAETQTEQQ